MTGTHYNTAVSAALADGRISAVAFMVARDGFLFIDLCWCREGESNPQEPKVGGF